MSNAKELTNDTFDATIKEGTVLVDFWAEWCAPCRAMGPVIDAIAADFEGKAEVAKVNVDENSELAARFSVQSIPTIIIFKNGEESKRFIGMTRKEDLTAALA